MNIENGQKYVVNRNIKLFSYSSGIISLRMDAIIRIYETLHTLITIIIAGKHEDISRANLYEMLDNKIISLEKE